jgi:hypothetical protein
LFTARVIVGHTFPGLRGQIELVVALVDPPGTDEKIGRRRRLRDERYKVQQCLRCGRVISQHGPLQECLFVPGVHPVGIIWKCLDEIIQFLDGLGGTLHAAKGQCPVIMDRPAVVGVGCNVSFERHQGHIVLIGIIIHQSAFEIIDLYAGIHQVNQGQVGIIGKRIILCGM